MQRVRIVVSGLFVCELAQHFSRSVIPCYCLLVCHARRLSFRVKRNRRQQDILAVLLDGDAVYGRDCSVVVLIHRPVVQVDVAQAVLPDLLVRRVALRVPLRLPRLSGRTPRCVHAAREQAQPRQGCILQQIRSDSAEEHPGVHRQLLRVALAVQRALVIGLRLLVQLVRCLVRGLRRARQRFMLRLERLAVNLRLIFRAFIQLLPVCAVLFRGCRVALLRVGLHVFLRVLCSLHILARAPLQLFSEVRQNAPDVRKPALRVLHHRRRHVAQRRRLVAVGVLHFLRQRLHLVLRRRHVSARLVVLRVVSVWSVRRVARRVLRRRQLASRRLPLALDCLQRTRSFRRLLLRLVRSVRSSERQRILKAALPPSGASECLVELLAGPVVLHRLSLHPLQIVLDILVRDGLEPLRDDDLRRFCCRRQLHRRCRNCRHLRLRVLYSRPSARRRQRLKVALSTSRSHKTKLLLLLPVVAVRPRHAH